MREIDAMVITDNFFACFYWKLFFFLNFHLLFLLVVVQNCTFQTSGHPKKESDELDHRLHGVQHIMNCDYLLLFSCHPIVFLVIATDVPSASFCFLTAPSLLSLIVLPIKYILFLLRELIKFWPFSKLLKMKWNWFRLWNGLLNKPKMMTLQIAHVCGNGSFKKKCIVI